MDDINWFLYDTWYGIITFALALVCTVSVFFGLLGLLLFVVLKKKRKE